MNPTPTSSSPSTDASPARAGGLAGDFIGLAARLGAPVSTAGDLAEALAVTPGDGAGRTPATPEALAAFLDGYLQEMLVPREWPLIVAAHCEAAAGHARELVALDADWRRACGNHPFAEASFRVGRRQLNRLRPLRDQRVVARYAAAVDAGAATGWHPVVFGLTLAVFGLPLRQGLMHFAAQTLDGFVAGAPVSAGLTEVRRAAILDARLALLPARLATGLPAKEGTLRVVV